MRYRAVAVLALPVFLVAAECATEPPPPDTCETGLTLSVGTPVTGAVAGGDCALDGRHADSYAFSLNAQTLIHFAVNGTTETDIRIRSGDNEVALYEDGEAQYNAFVILTPGDYVLDVAAHEDGENGDYTINTFLPSAANAPVGCLQQPGQRLWVRIGVDAGAAITANDCPGAPGFRADMYLVYMPGGQARTITITGVDIGNNVEIRRFGQTTMLKQQARQTAGANVVTFTPPADDYYAIGVIWGVNGTYAIRIQ